MSEEPYVHEGGIDAIKEGDIEKGSECKHTGVEGKREAPGAGDSDSVKRGEEAERLQAEYAESERVAIFQISSNFLSGHDVGDTVKRICEEIWLNRKMLLQLRD